MGRAVARRKVLFVEDESSIRTTYARCFASSYEMVFAGRHGGPAATSFEPDVLVLDMRLPDTDGIACSRKSVLLAPVSRWS